MTLEGLLVKIVAGPRAREAEWVFDRALEFVPAQLARRNHPGVAPLCVVREPKVHQRSQLIFSLTMRKKRAK